MPARKTMKAAVFVEPGRIELQDLPIPQAGPAEVLLRVDACGVCGTDKHIFEGELTDGVHPPVVLGHEIAARVEATGKGADAFEVGRTVAVDPLIGCGRCVACRSARTNLCTSPTTIGYKLSGGFAQYLVVPESKVVPLARSAGVKGGVLCETLACVVHGYDRLAMTAGANVLILGAGTVGLLWLQLLRNSPCAKIVQSEIVAFRRDKARALGADVVIDPACSALTAAVRAELPDGADFIIDATGDLPAVQEAIGLLARGATMMIFGVCPPGAVQFDPFELYNKEAKIVASKMPPGTLDRAARIIEAGLISCDEIVTATLGIDQAPEAIAAFNDHRDSQVKVAIDPWA